MANEVIINIPGIGDVVAENAASDATLREILAALNGRSGGGGTSGGSGGGGSTSGSNNATNETMQTVKKFASNVDNAGKKVVETIESLSRLNGSVTAAANVVGDLARNIPLFGKTLQAAFGAVAVAQTDLIKSYQKSSEAGASFAGSLNTFVASASYAGLTLNEYGQFVAGNSESLRLLSDNTEEGAKRFSVLSKVLRETSSELFSLGYSTDDLNKGIVQYIQNQQYYGNINKKSNSDLVNGTKAYLLELDTLAKVTGQSRDKIANDLATLNVDTEFRSFIDSLGGGSEKAGKELEETLGSVGPKMSSFMKDMITHGVPTTDENATIMSVFPKLAAEALKYRQELQHGTATEESRQRLMNTAAKESITNSKGWMNSVSGFADSGLKGAKDLASEGVKLSEDMRKSAIASQDKDLQSKDNLIKSYSDFQKKITEVGNTFTNVLARSGVFDTLTKMFTVLSETVGTVFTPMFNAFGASMKTLTDQLSEWLTPALGSLRDLLTYIPSVLREAFSPLGELLKSKFGDVLGIITGMADKSSFNAKEVATKLSEWIGTTINTGYSYFRKFWVGLEEVSARIQLYALSMDTMKMTVLRFLIAMDTVAGWFGVSGAKEAKAQHESQLGLEEALFVLAHKERKEKEDELHRTISDTTKKYKEINDELTTLNNKVKENSQNVKPEGAAPAGQAAAAAELQKSVDETKPGISQSKLELARGYTGKALTGLSEEQTKALSGTIAARESGGKQGIVNSYGYSGLYQMGAAALTDLGLVDRDKYFAAKKASGKNWFMDKKKTGQMGGHEAFLRDPSNWKVEGGLNSFLGSRSMQDAAFHDLVNKNIAYGMKSGHALANNASSQKIAGYALAAHLGGAGAAENYYTHGKDKADAYGSKASAYAAMGENAVSGNLSRVNEPVSKPVAAPVSPGYTYQSNGEGGMFKTNLETSEVTLASPAEIANNKNSAVNQSSLNNIATEKQARDEEFKKQQEERAEAEAVKQKQSSSPTADNTTTTGNDQHSELFSGLMASMNAVANNTSAALDLGQQQVSATRGVSGNLYAH